MAVKCIVQKSRPSSNLGVKGQRPKSPGQKKRKRRHCSGAVLGVGARVVSSASCTPVGKSAHAVYNLLKSVFLKQENSANKLLFEVFCQESARRNVAKMKDKSIK